MKIVDYILDLIDHRELRARMAEADAKLAWQRVTELQAASTNHLIEQRALRVRVGELLAERRELSNRIRGWLVLREQISGNDVPTNTVLELLAARFEQGQT